MSQPVLHGDTRIVQLDFPPHIDGRGRLVEMDFVALPFTPVRMFLVEGREAGTMRGGHAHKACQQLLVCVQGAVMVEVGCAAAPERVRLDSPERALLIPARVWSRQIYESPGARLMVLASQRYDPASYITEADATGT